MICTDLEGLGLANDKAKLATYFVVQKFHISNSSLLPLVPFIIESIELCFPASNHFSAEKNKEQRTNMNRIKERKVGNS